MQPLTKHDMKKRDDRRAESIYARRRDIDNWHEQRRVEREIREVWQ